MSDFEKNVDDIFASAARNGKRIAAGAIIISLSILAIMAWAVIMLVLHFT
jgi:hypothetical protein